MKLKELKEELKEIELIKAGKLKALKDEEIDAFLKRKRKRLGEEMKEKNKKSVPKRVKQRD